MDKDILVKEIFRKQVMDFLAENKIDISGKKVRMYKYRGDWEVRIYGEPQEFPNTKKSRRMLKEPTDKFNCTFGIHSRKISLYSHINETDLKNAEKDNEEKIFLLECIKNG